MATMHDVLDAQWMYDNYKDGELHQLISMLPSILKADLHDRIFAYDHRMRSSYNRTIT